MFSFAVLAGPKSQILLLPGDMTQLADSVSGATPLGLKAGGIGRSLEHMFMGNTIGTIGKLRCLPSDRRSLSSGDEGD